MAEVLYRCWVKGGMRADEESRCWFSERQHCTARVYYCNVQLHSHIWFRITVHAQLSLTEFPQHLLCHLGITTQKEVWFASFLHKHGNIRAYIHLTEGVGFGELHEVHSTASAQSGERCFAGVAVARLRGRAQSNLASLVSFSRVRLVSRVRFTELTMTAQAFISTLVDVDDAASALFVF